MSDELCSHVDRIKQKVRPSSKNGCSECLRTGDSWVHLRLCLTCGEVGCCDSSPNRHASRHAAAADHPIVLSFEPGEDWSWCYVDQVAFQVHGLEIEGPSARE
jgi:uncharacterized UBP type Zn finger protein